MDLSQLIVKTFKFQERTKKLECNNCNFITEHVSVSTEITSLPEMMVIQLNRYKFTQGSTVKMDNPIRISKALDLSCFKE